MQVHHFKSAAFKLLGILTMTVAFISFTSPSGADRYEIYLNKKLVFQQFVSQESSAVKSFQLDRNNYNGSIDVVYSHCGAAGKDRHLKITDVKNNVIKDWNFGDGKDDKATMHFLVKDMLLAQKEIPASKLNIFYSSEQIPKGRKLATVILVDHNTAP